MAAVLGGFATFMSVGSWAFMIAFARTTTVKVKYGYREMETMYQINKEPLMLSIAFYMLSWFSMFFAVTMGAGLTSNNTPENGWLIAAFVLNMCYLALTCIVVVYRYGDTMNKLKEIIDKEDRDRAADTNNKSFKVALQETN